MQNSKTIPGTSAGTGSCPICGNSIIVIRHYRNRPRRIAPSTIANEPIIHTRITFTFKVSITRDIISRNTLLATGAETLSSPAAFF